MNPACPPMDYAEEMDGADLDALYLWMEALPVKDLVSHATKSFEGDFSGTPEQCEIVWKRLNAAAWLTDRTGEFEELDMRTLIDIYNFREDFRVEYASSTKTRARIRQGGPDGEA